MPDSSMGYVGASIEDAVSRNVGLIALRWAQSHEPWKFLLSLFRIRQYVVRFGHDAPYTKSHSVTSHKKKKKKKK